MKVGIIDPRCRAEHGAAGVTPCGEHGRCFGGRPHGSAYRVPGTADVRQVSWEERSPLDKAARKRVEATYCGHAIRTNPAAPLSLANVAACSLPKGHSGPHLQLEKSGPPEPAYAAGDRVILRRTVWDRLLQEAPQWCSTQWSAFLDAYDGEEHWPIRMCEAVHPRISLLPTFRSGEVLADLKHAGVLVRHDSGQELVWRRDHVIAEDQPEPARDRWGESDTEYAAYLAEKEPPG